MRMDVFEAFQAAAPTSLEIRGVTVTRGSRVRLHPAAGGDVVDLALSNRAATVESIETSIDGSVHVAVTIDEDPGRDLGTARFPGHRFFFTPAELEPLDEPSLPGSPHILVAGIGNIFQGDDAFGVAVARRMAALPQPAGVTIADYGIRSLDLAFALQHDFDLVVLVDAMARGNTPGTLYTIEPDIGAMVPAPDAHTMDAVSVLQLARWLGHLPDRVIVLGCEPESIEPREFADAGQLALAPPVQAAVDQAVGLLTALISKHQPQAQSGSES